MSKIIPWAMAIMEFEGFKKGSPSYNNNNPGNLKWGGKYDYDRFGHTMFPTFHEGWDKLVLQLTMAVNGRSKVYKPDMTLKEFHVKYSERNQTEYSDFVAKRLGVKTSTKIRELK